VQFAVRAAYYGEFVQLERRKKDGEFGAKRTVVSVMPRSELEPTMPYEAMPVSMVVGLGLITSLWQS